MSDNWFPSLVRFFEIDGTETVRVCLTADDIPINSRFRILEIRIDVDAQKSRITSNDSNKKY